MFAHAIVRRIAYVLVAAVLSWCGLGKVHAHGTYQCSTQSYEASAANACDRGQAYASASNAGNADAHCATTYPTWTTRSSMLTVVLASATSANGQYNAQFNCERHNGTSWVNLGGTADAHIWRKACVAPKVWNEALKQCFDPSECLARNASLPDHPTSRTYANACVAGCRIKAIGPTIGVDGIYSGLFQYSGDMCETPPILPRTEESKDPPQECKPAEAGMTFCVKRDGQHCASASNGQQVCWAPGETGEKEAGPVKQKRDAGTEAIPPNLQLPNGDTLEQSQGPITKTSTITDAGGNVRTITTTITNYTTTSGTDAGDTDEGEADDGSEDGGEGEDEEGTATGGGSCEQPPETTGDPVLGMVARQAWETRCAVEKTDAKSTGNIGDCTQPFTVEGNNANAQKLRALRKQTCPAEGTAPDPSEYTGEDEVAPTWTEHAVDYEPDESGFGWSRSCPTIPEINVMGQSISFNTGPLCDWLNVGGWFVLLLAGIRCLRMLTEA